MFILHSTCMYCVHVCLSVYSGTHQPILPQSSRFEAVGLISVKFDRRPELPALSLCVSTTHRLSPGPWTKWYRITHICSYYRAWSSRPLPPFYISISPTLFVLDWSLVVDRALLSAGGCPVIQFLPAFQEVDGEMQLVSSGRERLQAITLLPVPGHSALLTPGHLLQSLFLLPAFHLLSPTASVTVKYSYVFISPSFLRWTENKWVPP